MRIYESISKVSPSLTNRDNIRTALQHERALVRILSKQTGVQACKHDLPYGVDQWTTCDRSKPRIDDIYFTTGTTKDHLLCAVNKLWLNLRSYFFLVNQENNVNWNLGIGIRIYIICKLSSLTCLTSTNWFTKEFINGERFTNH